jgi:hypothetical protein
LEEYSITNNEANTLNGIPAADVAEEKVNIKYIPRAKKNEVIAQYKINATCRIRYGNLEIAALTPLNIYKSIRVRIKKTTNNPKTRVP